jgi:carnitine O-palmitoyltransferase 1
VLAGGDGLSIFIPHPRFWLRSAFRWGHRAHHLMVEAFSPVPLGIVAAAEAVSLTWLLTSKSGSFARNMPLSNILWDLDSKLPMSKYCSNEVRVAYLAFFAAFGIMASFTTAHRLLLRFLLGYMGWMDETRGKRSLKTVVWGFLLKYVYMRRAATPTLGLQSCLPSQPVPSLRETVDRYLLSMQPVLSAEDYAAVKDDAERFIKTEGPKLQRYLKFKYWTSTHYMSDWWLSVVYLRGRESIMINSNYFGLSLYRNPPSRNQAARAATMTRYFMDIKHQIDHETLPRITIQEVVPICMQQYTGAFSMTREPGHEQDKLVQYDSAHSRHVVVMCRGQFFKVNLYCHRTGRLLSRLQLEAAYQGILEACSKEATPPKESKFGALTALPRSEWAAIRTDLFKRDKINRVALDIIERAVFVVCLDENVAPYEQIEVCGRMGLHGSGADRWFDKSFCLCISADGNMIVNGEHAWADAPTLGHIMEMCMSREAKGWVALTEYAADGAVLPTPQEAEALAAGKITLYRPERILFNVTDALAAAAQHAHVEAKKLIADLELSSMNFNEYGKAIMKKAQVSPDAFVQMALQMAWFRDQGFFTQTYESGMARLFREGRTETIRSCSNESAAFVRSMEDRSATSAERLKLLRAACNRHQRITGLAMTGRGVDRHMFALYVVAVGTQTDSSFLSTAMKRGWKLSTSQIPQIMPHGEFIGNQHKEEWLRPAGGFGPVAKDGYGVCYTVAGENNLFFHVTGSRECGKTDATRMRERIREALRDLHRVIMEAA